VRIDIDAPEFNKIRNIVKNDPILHGLLTCSLAELETWIQNNMNDSQTALAVLKRIMVICWYLAKDLRNG
jgi:hypothetical protein